MNKLRITSKFIKSFIHDKSELEITGPFIEILLKVYT